MSKIKSAKTLRKPPPITAHDPVCDNFEVELYWCVQQLENALNSGKLTQKIAKETEKNLKVLKSNSAPLVKKRQLMKAALGDYRAKMRDEEKKLTLASKQIKFTPQSATEGDRKGSFVRKSAILSSGKDFRFNFKPDMTAEHDSSPSTVVINRDLNLTSGGNFKFNFVLEEKQNDLNLSGLSIKS